MAREHFSGIDCLPMFKYLQLLKVFHISFFSFLVCVCVKLSNCNSNVYKVVSFVLSDEGWICHQFNFPHVCLKFRAVSVHAIQTHPSIISVKYVFEALWKPPKSICPEITMGQKMNMRVIDDTGSVKTPSTSCIKDNQSSADVTICGLSLFPHLLTFPVSTFWAGRYSVSV